MDNMENAAILHARKTMEEARERRRVRKWSAKSKGVYYNNFSTHIQRKIKMEGAE